MINHSDRPTEIEEDVIIADIQQEDKSMTKTIGNGKQSTQWVNLLSPTSSKNDPEEIDTDCGTDCKALTEALMIQQKMTKLLIQELKNDQEKVVEKVLESINKVDNETVKSLVETSETQKQQIGKLSKQMDKYTGK